MAVSVLLLLGTTLTVLKASEPDMTPLAFVREIDVDINGPNALYFSRIFPDGRANLSFGSAEIAECPANTFNFGELYKKLSILPGPNYNGLTYTHNPYNYCVSFRDKRYDSIPLLEREAKGVQEVGRFIKDPEIVRNILTTFIAHTMFDKQAILKRFSESPPFPANK